MKKILYTFFFLGGLMLFANTSFAQMEECPDCAYKLTASDTFGDGWNGAAIQIITPTEVINYAGPAAAGPDCIDFLVNTGDVITVNETAAGTFANEVEYSISGPTGDVPVNVTAPNFTGSATFSFAAVCPVAPVSCDMEITVNLTDSFGDGWNGGTLDVTASVDGAPGVTTTVGTAFTTGAAATEIVTVSVPKTLNPTSTVAIETVFNAGGFVGEVGYAFDDPTALTCGGTIISSDLAANINVPFGGAAGGQTGSGTVVVTCPADAVPVTGTNLNVSCGIYEVGKLDFTQAPGASAECDNGFSCVSGLDCTEAAAVASSTTTGFATGTAAATGTTATSFTMTYTPGADPLAAIEVELCGIGDIDGTFGEDYDFVFADGTMASAGQTGNFADQCAGDINNPVAAACVTVCLAPSAVTTPGSLTFDVIRDGTVSTTLCATNAWTANATFFFVPGSGGNAACITWFAGPCETDEAIFMGESLSFAVIQDLIAAGDLDPSVLCHEQIVTFYISTSCGEGESERIPVDLFVFNPCTDGCAHYLEITDSGSDGWEGASLMVSVNEGASETIKLSASEGPCRIIQYCLSDGETLDLQYWEGADNFEHGFNVIGFDGEILLANGPGPSTDMNRVTASCPDVGCAGETIDATVRITTGAFPDFMSWEIYDGFNNVNCQGPQVVGVTANTYAGLAPGTVITVPVQFEACEEYTVALFDGFNIGWNGATWELITDDIDYGNEITNPNDPFFGQSLVKFMDENDFGPPNDLNSALPGDEARMAFTFPCKPNCQDASSTVLLGNCFADATILPIAAPEICYPDCNHALGCDIQFRHTILNDGNDNNIAFQGMFAPVDGMTEVDYTATAGFQMSAGCHTYVTEYLYCDGLITKCTSNYVVAPVETSNFACNDNVIVPLRAPDFVSTGGANNGGSIALSDDLGECVIQVTADLVIEGGVGSPANINCEFFNINDFYEVVVLDANDQPLVTFSANGLPLDSNGAEILPGSNTQPANNFVSYNEIKQTLKYTITHKLTGTTCWGTLTVEDKNAPTIVATNYDVNCNDPNVLDEFFSESITYESSAANELPANIAGGDVGALRSNTWIPFTVGCGRLGTNIQDITINLSLTHNEVTDLGVELHIPTAFNNTLANPFPGAMLTLDQVGDVGAVNTYTPNPNNDSPDLLGLLGASCKLAESEKDVNFISESTGMNLPQGHGKTWYVNVTDNGVSYPVPPFGGGQITAITMTIECGYPFPFFAFDCALDNVELLSEIVDEDCAGPAVIRVWQAIDACGQSATATQTVSLLRPSISDLILPSTDVTIECGTEQLDADGNIDPAQSGFPEFCCDQVVNEDLCQLTLSFEDDVIPSCGNSTKILRTWSILNWCTPTNTPTQLTQLIVVGDTTPPMIDASGLSAISAGADCTGTLSLADLPVTDGCSEITALRIEYTTGSTYAGTSQTFITDLLAGETLSGLPMGTTSATITATDECANTATVDVDLNVVDNTAPTAICDDGLNISLNSDGTARVFATDFDEGSNDNCSDVTVTINGGEFVDFDCSDLGTVTLTLEVTDAAGNVNTCWADLLVEDPIGPSITPKDDITINCEDGIGAEDLFTLPESTDNCGSDVTMGPIITVDLPNCGQLLTTTFTATDGSDKSDDDTDTQSITVLHVSDFIVQFPADVDFDNCELGDVPGPIITEDDCEMVSISIEDRTFVQVPGACYQIERTYTVINNCIVDDPSAGGFTDLGTPLPIPNTFRDDDGYFQFTQIITVNDDVAPSIEFTAPDPCDFTDGCEGEAVLTATAEDDCADLADVTLSYEIDAFSDGTVDITGNGDDATGTYPYGDHTITWIATDGCGNVTVEEYDFSVEDCKNPTPVGQGVTTVVMNNGECVSIWALDLLEYAEDNCTERTEEEWDENARIRREGSNGPLTTSLELCCEDIADGAVNIEVWVEDEAGNADFIIVAVVIQDNGGNCPTSGNGSSALISGKTATETGNDVMNAEVSVGTDVVMTADNGVYQSNQPTDNMYTVTPEKLDDITKGISTFDLVLMAQHVLQINQLTTPYQHIAADVDNDGDIDIFDMVELRSLILFSINNFSNNTPWRFVDAAYTFQNPTAPWSEAYPEFIDVQLVGANAMMNQDFVAVKIGDLDGDALAPLTGSVEERTTSTLTMVIDDVEMSAGNDYKVDFRASDFNDVTGYQFTLDFDQNAADFVSVEAGALNVDESNFGFTMLDEGIITTSFAEMGKATSVENDEVLFSITFAARANATLNNVISLTNQYTVAEAYNAESEVSNVQLAFNNAGLVSTTGGEFELFQNKPNPFSESSLIGFNLPEATTATLRIFDVSGKTLKVITANYARGYNEVDINRNDLGAAGVLYYQLDTDADSAVKKMIILE